MQSSSYEVNLWLVNVGDRVSFEEFDSSQLTAHSSQLTAPKVPPKVPIEKFRDYRAYLKACLKKGKRENPRYSLRRFARDLETSSQLLSLLIKKKKGISLDMAARFSTRLSLNVEETDYFCNLVDLARVKSKEAKKIIRYRMDRYKKR